MTLFTEVCYWILFQLKQRHILPSYLKTNFNIILPSAAKSYKWSLTFIVLARVCRNTPRSSESCVGNWGKTWLLKLAYTKRSDLGYWQASRGGGQNTSLRTSLIRKRTVCLSVCSRWILLYENLVYRYPCCMRAKEFELSASAVCKWIKSVKRTRNLPVYLSFIPPCDEKFL